MTDRRWRPGQTVVERFHRPDGSIGQVHPLRVLADDGRVLLAWLPAGTPIVGSRLADGRELREAPLDQRFRIPRVPVPDFWHRTSTLRRIAEDEWSSVWWFFDAAGEFKNWYVNLEVPLGRNPAGVDRIDGVLDVVVERDGTWRWDDEDEAEAAIEVGRLTLEQFDRLRVEGERIGALAERGAYPFDGTDTDFRPDPGWPVPELPPGLLASLSPRSGEGSAPARR
ncbi:DUF402 domain-containing protein [Amycolatopsis vancoresmycina]|uniref:DUF402 domain-containing protein n=1 Tax=Amycolatopsis vancoresmycina DSM 44592 TaxID=1292037 RepID=R1I7K9_9PSEU|nr:DUF402 domain-containing protein [Amycolatopsis vancoresmycina]EOD68496.1 hypothetical protein H480_11020 [Amycolatopsis vancoresmycina DSM 44592]